VLHEIAAHWGPSGVQALAAAEARSRSTAAQPAPAAAGPGAIPAAAPEHTASAHQIAERDALNAVITVVARGPDGAALARWRARGRWVGPLPVRYHGSRVAAVWSWSDPAARETRLHTQPDGSDGVTVEAWAVQHGAVTVDVVASAIDAASPDDETSEASADPSGSPSSDAAHDQAALDPLAGLDAEHQRLVIEFERSIGIDPDQDAEDDTAGGHGARGGDPHGRTGADTAIGGTGPGGPKSHANGDQEGSETRGAVEGSRLGSALGVEGGSEGGRFGGEGRPGDDGVTMGGAIKGGVIAVPLALKGAVDVLLIAEAGDVTGAGAQAFKALGKEAAKMSAASLRTLVANEARAACERELRAAIERMARSPKSTGYPDFEPHALTLPNGKKTVHIELTGDRAADVAAANRAAGLKQQPRSYTWHTSRTEAL
jgi:hypothetical protein